MNISQRVKVSSWFTIKIVINEREISGLLEYFTASESIFEVYLKCLYFRFHCFRHSHLPFSLKTNDLQNLNLRQVTIKKQAKFPYLFYSALLKRTLNNECKGKQFTYNIINRTILFVIVLLLTLPGDLRYFYLMQIHVCQDNIHE